MRKSELPWSFAEERLRDERNYWVVTMRRGGIPQARPVWGLWNDDGLFLSVGHGGLQRAELVPRMPVSVHVDSAVEVVIVEGTIDRIVGFEGGGVVHEATLDVSDTARRRATLSYNEKYSWNFSPQGGDLNFLVQPSTVFAWISRPTEVEASSKWTFVYA